MNVDEILHRFRQLCRQIFARLLRKQQENLYKNTSGTTTIVDMMEGIRFYGLDDAMRQDVPDKYRANTIITADKLLEHRFDCFAINGVYIGDEVDWDHELKRNIDTPLEFAPWMNYRDTQSYGHFKYFWELGRFQHLITLAKAYHLTGKEEYASEVAEQIESFVKQCPYLLGIHWIMPMEASIRLVSIAWIVAFMKEYLKHNVETCNLIEQIIKSHVDYIANNFSRFSSANNHLIGEVTGVFLASFCFEGLEGMARYKHRMYEMLCKEISLQFYSDGVNKEQATHYHISCYNCFLLAGLLGHKNGLEFPKEYWDVLEKGVEYISAMHNDDNSVPNIGDSDDGKTILLSESDYNQAQSLLATSAVLFKRGDFKAKAKYFDEMSLWLLGRTGKQVFDALDPDEKKTLPEKFEEGGYYILSDNSASKAKIIFDCGPLGFGSIAAHGHADTLSFMLYVDGCQFFIDPGTYTFEAENPYRNYFRSTAAHNTISIDGKDQSEMAGAFLWGRKANSFIEEWVSNNEISRVTGWHDGYKRLDDPVVHRRTIELNKKQSTVSIKDYIEAKLLHDICMYFHLAPECEITGIKRNQWKIINKGKEIELIVDELFTCEVIKGSEDPICGWASKKYDAKNPTNTIICSISSEGNQRFSTKIVL